MNEDVAKGTVVVKERGDPFGPYLKTAFRAWLALWGILLATQIFPVRSTMVRILILALTVALWGGGLALFWKHRVVRVVGILAGLAVAALFLLPGRPESADVLRPEYVRAISSYTGTRFVWGGETHLGVDCSGLVRCGLFEADFTRGLATFNPALMREGLALWWYDSSADALMHEYRRNSHLVQSVPDLNTLDYSRIQPGDFAVMSGGNHVMAYIGDRTWIEADPSDGKVVQVKIPTSRIWFEQPVNILRWRQLSQRR